MAGTDSAHKLAAAMRPSVCICLSVCLSLFVYVCTYAAGGEEDELVKVGKDL
jgi:hypothetical protein